VGFAELFRLPLANGLVIALAFLLIHVVFRGFFRRRKIQRGTVDRRLLLHELFFTSTTLMLGGVIGMVTIYLLQRRVAVIEYGETTLLTVLAQSLLYLLLFDLYFYAVHRVLHVVRRHARQPSRDGEQHPPAHRARGVPALVVHESALPLVRDALLP
jgi:sterol desaturase/sphingolipid hydroxylase (fatty acid hydroxylase superfamily)